MLSAVCVFLWSMGVWMNLECNVIVAQNPMLCILAGYENSKEKRDPAICTLYDTVSLVNL